MSRSEPCPRRSSWPGPRAGPGEKGDKGGKIRVRSRDRSANMIEGAEFGTRVLSSSGRECWLGVVAGAYPADEYGGPSGHVLDVVDLDPPPAGSPVAPRCRPPAAGRPGGRPPPRVGPG